MKLTIFLLFGFLAAHSAESLAQTYKCSSGNKTVFSDTPCSSDARKIYDGGKSVSAARNTSNGPKETGEESCKTAVSKQIIWDDPESIRIGKTSGGEMEVLDYAETKIGARRFSVYVNAKNSYGAYIGEKPITCFTSQDGMRVLKINR